jgi:galactokinase
MRGREIAERLVAAGLVSGEASGKARLFDLVLGLTPHEGGAPAAWFVPGRLEVFGTHTDYAGGRSMVAAVPRGFAVAASRRDDGQVRVTDALAAEGCVVDPERRPDRHRGWRHYVEVAAARLARNFPGAPLGADIVFASDLPRAAGMSSSSALVVAVATALVHAGGIRERPEWTAHIRDAVDEAGYAACIENGRSFGSLTGDLGVGTHGGSEDHGAMLAGVAGACRTFAFVPMRVIDTVPVPEAWTIVVASSGVGSHKTGAQRGAYNRLAEGAAALLHTWNARGEPAPSLAVALDSRAGALSLLRSEIAGADVPGWTTTELENRLEHFVREDRRVEAASRAFAQMDATALGEAALASQLEAETLLQNQVPETALLTRLAREAGAFASRSFGAGFGGSVWAIIDRGDPAAFVERWTSAYRNASPASEWSAAFVAHPGPPVTRVL